MVINELNATLSQPEMDLLSLLLGRYEETDRESVIFPTSVLLKYARKHLSEREGFNSNEATDNDYLEHLTYLIVNLSLLEAIVKVNGSYEKIKAISEFEITPSLTELYLSKEFMDNKKEVLKDIRSRYLNKNRQLYLLRL